MTSSLSPAPFAFLAIIALTLSGCMTAGDRVSRIIDLPQQRPASYAKWASDTNANIRSSVALNARGEAFLAYRTTIAADVDAGRLSPEQMDYMSRKALVEVVDADKAEAKSVATTTTTAGPGDGLILLGAALAAPRSQVSQPTSCSTYRLGNTLQTHCY